jgi:hypothetical protein
LSVLQSNDDSSLLKADIPDQKIKSGFLQKVGNSIKTWKKRHFIALNQAENYIIKYYDENDEVKEKGVVSCFGYI